MAANKHKQNLRYKKVAERINKKVRYDGLTKEQIKYIKTKQEYDNIEKSMNDFWRYAPRLKNNQVNWDNMTEQELGYFEYINGKQEKLFIRLNKLEEDGLDVDTTMNMFMMLNINSVSF